MIARLFSLLSETFMNRAFQTLLHCVALTARALYVGKIVTEVFTITEADFDTDCFRLKIELNAKINDLRQNFIDGFENVSVTAESDSATNVAYYIQILYISTATWQLLEKCGI